ncbi:hypothetical protein KVG88_30320 [Pseudomonas sp. SWRI74]|uniref:ETC complex I subunit n=1 Tax=Pseudomonas azerbaijanoccidentalis TaxID=2842347 RepID=A0ABS6QZK9_9PSED|nr:hypothetical protein [Pseudomonas azerbaijanoccidentalis]MBV4524372.1 hypothetical protein [Pseudomonas azerbaijanoccidentalis]
MDSVSVGPVPLWREFRPSSWTRTDGAGASQPHGWDDKPEADYWLAWAPYITGDRKDVGHPDKVMRRRFDTKEAAMKYADKTWPPGKWQDSE